MNFEPDSTIPGISELPRVEPLCPVFGQCGGCLYQDLPYEEELRIKRKNLLAALSTKAEIDPAIVSEVTPSPLPYHSRSRLDLTMRRYRTGEIQMGFMPPEGKRVIPVDSCAIARREISDAIPRIGKEAAARLPADYGNANIVIKTGDDGRVFWGGIGRRSLVLAKEDYLWTEIRGKRIHYSLETFFQANLSILPALMDTAEAMLGGKKKCFLDLYSGVGLFGIALSDLFERIIMIEEHPASTAIAEYNIGYHGLRNVENHAKRVEDLLPRILNGLAESGERPAAIIDPPRKGLSASALETMVNARQLESLLYLSCHPEALARDLAGFQKNGWKLERIVPFDFFPKTRHLETLVLLRP